MGTLPDSKTAWPPAEHTDRYSRMKLWSVWYAGDPAALGAHYGTGLGNNRPGFVTRAANWFWGKKDASAADEKFHVDVPGEIATLSADLLFSEAPRFEVQYTEFQEDGTPNPAQEATVRKAQERLDHLLDACAFESLLPAAAETCAALGSVALRIAYDKREQTALPVVARVDADAVVPEYRWGQLTAVTFWRTARKGETVFYHLERHERGFIEHGLYQGEAGNLGQRLPLADHEMTAALAPLVDAESRIATVDGGLTAVSIPNMLPDPLDRGSSVGRSDFSPGVIALFDQIDRTYSSLMRDVEDGRSRLLIADYMMNTRGAGKGLEFDTEQHLFTRLNRAPGENGDAPIDQVQFKIRVEEHLRTIEHLRNAVLKACGYNSDSDRGEDGGDMTATEYAGRNKRSLQTRDKKLRYWAVLEGLIETLLKVDATYFGSGVVPLPVKMIVPDAVQTPMRELAETAEIANRAGAVSTEEKVKILHPDWDQKLVDAEVEKIDRPAGGLVPDPASFGLPPAPSPLPERPVGGPVTADPAPVG